MVAITRFIVTLAVRPSTLAVRKSGGEQATFSWQVDVFLLFFFLSERGWFCVRVKEKKGGGETDLNNLPIISLKNTPSKAQRTSRNRSSVFCGRNVVAPTTFLPTTTQHTSWEHSRPRIYLEQTCDSLLQSTDICIPLRSSSRSGALWVFACRRSFR